MYKLENGKFDKVESESDKTDSINVLDNEIVKLREELKKRDAEITRLKKENKSLKEQISKLG